MDYAVFLLLNAVLFVRPGEFVADLAGVPIYNGLILLNLAVAAPKLLAKLSPGTIRREPITACILGLGGAIVLSHLARLDFYAAREGLVEFGKTAIYYLLLVAVLDTPARLRGFLGWTAGCVLVVTTLALLHYHEVVNIPALAAYNEGWRDSATGEQATIQRLRTTGIFNDPNDLSLILVVGIAAALYLWSPGAGGLPRPYWLAPAAVFLYALALTRSRGGFLAFLASVAVLCYVRLGARRAALALGLILPVLLAAFGGRQTAISAEEDTGQDRIQLWSRGFEMFRRSPLLGVGYNTYAEHAGLVAHNSYIHVLAELGVVGSSCFVGAIGYGLRSLVLLGRRGGEIADPALARLVPFLAAMLVGYGVGMITVTRSYSIPTCMVLGIVSAFLRMVARDSPALAGDAGPILPLGPRLLRWIAGVELGFVVLANVFVKMFVRWV